MSELYAVDVGRDFIATVVSYVKRRLEAGGHLTVLFPNRRAVRFFENQIASPHLLQITVAALEDFVRDAVFDLASSPPLYQCDIDRYVTLHDLIAAHPALYQRLGGEIAQVFPWCVHLSTLFDEFDQNLIPSVAPLPYIDDVVPEARAILLSLDTLYRDYRRTMEKENLTYRGDIYRRLDSLKSRLSGTFVLAGFALLTEAQRSIFQYLFRRHDTAVFFHTDLKGRHGWSNPYRLYDAWKDGSFWGVRPRELPAAFPDPPRRTIRFYRSFDTHAEARQLREAVGSCGVPDPPFPLDVGVVLPDGQALFPVLYALGDLSFPMNVTLGFPFERSVFYRLLDALMELALTRQEGRGFYYAPLNRFLSHPFVLSLRILGVPFRTSAERLQREIVARNLAFVSLEAIETWESLPPETRRQARWLHDKILGPFAAARSLDAAGRILVRLVHGFREALAEGEGADLERQMIQNFLDRVLPNLMNSQAAKRTFSTPVVLNRILRHLMLPLHLPFEGNPLEGVQVMGMLESRLLNFRHLFVLDLNEGILPQGIKIDPLLPLSLHPLLGLPSLKLRESLFQYNFFRLVDGAEDVHIFFQEGVSGEEKRVRSRYVEQLLLEEEIQKGGEGPLPSIRDLEATLIKTHSFQIPPPVRPEAARPSFYEEKVAAYLARGVSATGLDTYLDCPHRFYLAEILRMPKEEGISERQSPLDVGVMVHEILEQALTGFQGRPLTRAHLEQARRRALTGIEAYVRKGFPTLSPLRADLLIRLTAYRLNTFFDYFTEEISRYASLRVMGLERKFSAELKGIRFTGRIDRIDAIEERPGAPVRWRVIDYKTGTSAKIPSRRLSRFLQSLDSTDYSPEALALLKGTLRSVQLPLYLYLFREKTALNVGEAVEATLFLLGNPSGEMVVAPLQGSSLSQEEVFSLLRYLVEHMRHNPTVAPYTMDFCATCPYVRVCQHTTRAEAAPT